MACTGIHIIDPKCQLGSLANDAFTKMARSFASAAASAVDWLWKQIDQATTINLSSPGINKDLIATGAIAGLLCTALFLIQVITAALRREPGGLYRAVRGLGIAFLASAFAIATTKIVLAAVDELSSGVVKFATGGSIDGLGTRFALSVNLSQMQNPAALLLFAFVILAAVVVVWAAMLMRKLLIIVAAVMTPLAFAGGAADITRSWVRRWIEFTAALVASKLLLVVMLMIGLSVFEGAGMQTAGPGQQVKATQAGTQLATGSVLLLLAGFAPWIAIKMFHFAGDSLHSVHVQANAARAGTQSVVTAPRKMSSTLMTGRAMSGRTSNDFVPTASRASARSEAPNAASATPQRTAADNETATGAARSSSGAAGGAAAATPAAATVVAAAAPVSAARATDTAAGTSPNPLPRPPVRNVR
jgi:type IV secretion system protein TrbL